MRPGKRDTVFVGVGAVVSGLGGFGFTWAVARGSGVVGTGAVLTLTTWFTLLVGIAKLGMDTTLVREGGRIRAGAALVPGHVQPRGVARGVLAQGLEEGRAIGGHGRSLSGERHGLGGRGGRDDALYLPGAEPDDRLARAQR